MSNCRGEKVTFYACVCQDLCRFFLPATREWHPLPSASVALHWTAKQCSLGVPFCASVPLAVPASVPLSRGNVLRAGRQPRRMLMRSVGRSQMISSSAGSQLCRSPQTAGARPGRGHPLSVGDFKCHATISYGGFDAELNHYVLKAVN